MYNILVCNSELIKDYDRNYQVFHNVTAVLDGENNVILIYSDLNDTCCQVYQIDSPIENFIGNKYKYVEGKVVLNENFMEE
jgi:hypothetical protein